MAGHAIALEAPERHLYDDHRAPERLPRDAVVRSGSGNGLWARTADPRSLLADAAELRERGLYVWPEAMDRIGISLFLDGADVRGGCLFCPDWSTSGTDLDCIEAFARHERTDAHRARVWQARCKPHG